MTKNDIIRMAREAGGADISSNGWTSWVGTQSTEFLERFANLVAAAEREECARLCQEIMQEHNPFDRQAGVARRCLDDIRARGTK